MAGGEITQIHLASCVPIFFSWWGNEELKYTVSPFESSKLSSPTITSIFQIGIFCSLSPIQLLDSIFFLLMMTPGTVLFTVARCAFVPDTSFMCFRSFTTRIMPYPVVVTVPAFIMLRLCLDPGSLLFDKMVASSTFQSRTTVLSMTLMIKFYRSTRC